MQIDKFISRRQFSLCLPQIVLPVSVVFKPVIIPSAAETREVVSVNAILIFFILILLAILLLELHNEGNKPNLIIRRTGRNIFTKNLDAEF